MHGRPFWECPEPLMSTVLNIKSNPPSCRWHLSSPAHHLLHNLHHPFRWFASHHVVIHQPEYPLGQVSICRQQNYWLYRKPSLDVPRYGFGVHSFRFVLDEDSSNRRAFQHSNSAECSCGDVYRAAQPFKSGFPNPQKFRLVINAQENWGRHDPLSSTSLAPNYATQLWKFCQFFPEAERTCRTLCRGSRRVVG